MLDYAKNYSLRLIFAKVIHFTIAMLISRGSVFGTCYPFGLSLTAAIGTENLVPTVMGAILGYIVPLGMGCGIRYVTAIISIIAMKWAINDIEKIKNNALTAPMMVFISIFVTGLATNLAQSVDKYAIFITILECFVGAGISYFLFRAFNIIYEKNVHLLNAKEFTYVMISLSVLLISFLNISIHGVSLGRIFGILTILIITYIKGISAGALTGAIVGAMFSLASGKECCTPYSFCGAITGIFSAYGRIGSCIALLISYIIMSFGLGNASYTVVGTYEMLAAIFLFLAMPNSFFAKMKVHFSSFEAISNNGRFMHYFKDRLKLISSCLSTIPECLDKTSADLKTLNSMSMEESCLDCVKSHCAGCSSRKFCWIENSKYTYEDVRGLINKSSTDIDSKFTKEYTSMRLCKNSKQVEDIIDIAKKEFLATKLLGSQTKKYKHILKNYFEKITDLMDCIGREVDNYNDIDEALSIKVERALNKRGILKSSAKCVKLGENLAVEIESHISQKHKFTNSFVDEISMIVGKDLEAPIVSLEDDIYKLRFLEEKKYKINFSISQHAFNGGKFCGDNCKCFEDGRGKCIVVLSDGMGSGSEAALEASLVATLVKKFFKLGFSSDLTIKMINSILLMNEKTESLVTMDLLSIDLFTGMVKSIKAGSPSTFLIRQNEIRKISFSSLPVGILKDTSFSEENFKTQPGDIIVMLSDGVTDIGDEWTLDLLKNINSNIPCEISKIIVGEAVKARKNSRDDDISAIVLSVEQKS